MRRTATTVQQYLLMLWLAGVAVTVFLAGLGIFEVTRSSTLSTGSTKLVEANDLDPHRIAGSLLILVGLLVLIAGVVARLSSTQLQMSIGFGVLSVVQMFLAGAGADSGALWGGLHVLNAFLLTGMAIGLLIRDRRLLTAGAVAGRP